MGFAQKIKGLSLLNSTLRNRVLKAYLRKLCKLQLTDGEFAMIAYYNMLLRSKSRHVKQIGDMFVFENTQGRRIVARPYPSSDLTLYDQIWLKEEYKGVADLITKNIEGPTLNIIDAGANVGYVVLYLNHLLSEKYDLNFVCIEPSEDNLFVLEKNLLENKIDNVRKLKAGLHNKSCYLKVNRNFRDGKDWSIQVEEAESVTDLKGVEIGDIVESSHWNSIDFLKIDIEGGERHLFADKQYASSFLKKVRIISIEIHEEYNIESRILGTLKENGFSYFQTGEITIGINMLFFNGNIKTDED